MRGVLSVDDFIKLAAGIMIGLFILFIAYVFITNYISTECWRQTMGPFDDALLGVSTLNSKLGSQSFPVAINPGSDKCLKELSFANDRFACSEACKRSGLSSNLVTGCQQDCTSKCSKGCIVFTPTDSWKIIGGIGFNKPRVYGESTYKMDFSWNSKSGEFEPITGSSGVKCLLFTLSGTGNYKVEPLKDSGRCK